MLLSLEFYWGFIIIIIFFKQYCCKITFGMLFV